MRSIKDGGVGWWDEGWRVHLAVRCLHRDVGGMGTAAAAPGMGLEGPEMVLDGPEAASDAPRMGLEAPGMGLEAPEAASDVPGMGLEAPGMSLEAHTGTQRGGHSQAAAHPPTSSLSGRHSQP